MADLKVVFPDEGVVPAARCVNSQKNKGCDQHALPTIEYSSITHPRRRPTSPSTRNFHPWGELQIRLFKFTLLCSINSLVDSPVGWITIKIKNRRGWERDDPRGQSVCVDSGRRVFLREGP